MNKNKLIIILCCVYIFLYIVFKTILVYNSDLFMNNEIYDKTYSYAKVININKINVDETINIKELDMSIGNYFSDFKETEKNKNYIKYENNEDNTSLIISKDKSVLSQINNTDINNVFGELYYYPMYISETLRNHFIKKNNINNDIDLIKYIRKRNKEKNTFFTSIIKIKENYFFDYIESTIYNDINSITYIEGDYNGYIIDYKDYKEVYLLDKDNLYNFVFVNNEYFDEDHIKEIISTIKIK